MMMLYTGWDLIRNKSLKNRTFKVHASQRNPELVNTEVTDLVYKDVVGVKFLETQDGKDLTEAILSLKVSEVKVGHLLKHDIPDGFYPVYCGRAGHGYKGTFGNPFTQVRYPRGKWIKPFKKYLDDNPQIIKELAEKGDKLFLQCFCKKKIDDHTRCHCDILKDYVQNTKKES